MAITLVMVSAIIYLLPNSFGWWKEFSKSMMGLGTTVIIGGLIKLLVDEYAKNKEKLTKKREFQNELLNRLRKVFDDVDVARLLISAQRSAKTYGELIRNSIIPASVTLYDIKRSLVDSLEDQIEQNKRDELRVNIHYMLAYLRVLIAVYKKSYLQISNLQLLHEAFKEKIKKTSVELFEKENNGLFSSGVGLQQLPNLFYKQEYGKETLNQLSEDLWNKIESLEYMDDFTKEGNNTKYYTIFIEHYEDCKRILKGTKDLVRNDPPDGFENYLNQLEIIENKKKEGLLQEADNLVNIIMREKLRYSV
jgi:hypothetical protein